MHYLAVALVSAVVAFPVFGQQEVLWSNPAGGSFGLGSNWQGGSMPTSTQRGVFTVGGTYSVTGPGPYQVIGLRFVGGEVTLNVPGGFNIWEVVIGDPLAARTTFNLQSGFNRYDSSPGLQGISIRNAVVRGGSLIGPQTNVGITDNSDVLVQAAFQTFGRISVDSTSLLTITGVNGNAEQISSSGRLVLTNASLSLNSFSLGGQVTATNGGFGGDGGSISGGPHLFTNAGLHALHLGGTISGDVTFMRMPAGPSTNPAFSNMSITGGRVVLRGGARAGGPFLSVTNATLDVGDGCPTQGVNLGANAVLRAGGHALMNSEMAGNVLLSSSSRVVMVLDALDLPIVAPISLRLTQSLAGSLAVEVENSNALVVGQQVPLLELRPDITGQFGSIEVPVLQGGRSLQVVFTPTHVMLQVVAGGPDPCWTADFNGDGDFGTDADIAAFFACLAGNCCATCGRVDFNSDGDTGTDADIEAFFRILAGGAC